MKSRLIAAVVAMCSLLSTNIHAEPCYEEARVVEATEDLIVLLKLNPKKVTNEQRDSVEELLAVLNAEYDKCVVDVTSETEK